MSCPLCNSSLKYNEKTYSYSCPTTVLIKDREFPHYQTHRFGCIMIALPYRIVNYNDYSVVQIIMDDCFGYYPFEHILNTSELNLGPIIPKSEKDLINRIQTILVFS